MNSKRDKLMKNKYLVSINSTLIENKELDGKIIETDTPIQYLRKAFPEFIIARGNGWNWNISLYNKENGTNFLYTVKPKKV